MSDDPVTGVSIELDQLSPGALRGLIEEFVTREGTDYGDGSADGRTSRAGEEREWTLEDKVQDIREQLERGEAQIVYDLELGSASIVPVDRGE